MKATDIQRHVNRLQDALSVKGYYNSEVEFKIRSQNEYTLQLRYLPAGKTSFVDSVYKWFDGADISALIAQAEVFIATMSGRGASYKAAA